MFSKGFSSDGARNEMSTRQHNTAIIVEYTLSVMNVLLEYFAAAHLHRNDNGVRAVPRSGVWPEVLEHSAY